MLRACSADVAGQSFQHPVQEFTQVLGLTRPQRREPGPPVAAGFQVRIVGQHGPDDRRPGDLT